MKLFNLILFIYFLNCGVTYSQVINISNTSEKKLLSNILQDFKNQHQFNFSYDIKAIKNIKLLIKKETISIVDLQEIIEQFTSYVLEEVDPTNYILIKNSKIINICGIVIDDVSKFELIQAEILLDNKIIEITDNQGMFEVGLHPSDSIAITYLGYQKKEFRASELSTKSCDTIRLQPEIETLEQVLVQEYLTGGISKNQDASVNISTKKLRILPGLAEPDVLQSLQLLPGISSPTEDPAGLYIRGGTPGQNLVLWDGIKMYQNGHFFNQISTFNPFITKNVQVYRGGTSVRYGDRISGVINIESDDDLTDSLKIGGGLNLTHMDLYLKIPLSRKIGVLIAGRRSTTDIYKNINYNNLVRKVFQNTRAAIASTSRGSANENRDDDFSFSDGNFKILWNPNQKNSVKFSSIFSENRLDNSKKIMAQSFFSINDVYVKDVLKIRNIGFSLNWKKEFYKNISHDTNLYLSSYDQRYTLGRVYNATEFNPESISRYNKNNVIQDIGFEYNIHIPLTQKHDLNLGYQFTNVQTKYEIIEETENIVTGQVDDRAIYSGNGSNHILYTEYNYKSPKKYISMGVRATQLSNSNSLFIEPRIFSSYKLNSHFTINASAELKNQQLNNYANFGTLSELSDLPVSDNLWLISNNNIETNDDGFSLPFIRLLKSRQFTFGVLYTYKGWNVDIESYYKKINDISNFGRTIVSLALADSNNLIDIFYGTEERLGIDFLLKKRMRNYRFWASYSLSKTINSFPLVQDAYYIGDYDQLHVFNFSQTLKVNKFEFALGWNFASGRPFTQLIRDDNDNDGVIIDPNGINSSRLKNYHRLDASVVYNTKSKKNNWNTTIGISLRNIYNRKNIISQSYSEVLIEEQGNFVNYLENIDNESIRFTPDLVIRFNF